MALETDADRLSMRVGVRTKTLSEERLTFCKQLGVEDVFVDHRQPDGDVFDDGGSDDPETIAVDAGVVPSVSELVHARRRAEDAGVRLMGIHSLGYNVYGKIMLGEDGADEQLETIKTLLRNLGRADIPILGYQWNPRGLVPMRTSRTARIRGDAKATAFDADDLPDHETPVGDRETDHTEADLWDNYAAFIEEVIPVAEEAGVRMALHPADPPTVERIGGIPRLFRNVAAFERALGIVDSDAHGLKLCLGCFSEMVDADVVEVIERFSDDTVFVHFRDVIGTWPSFTETFVDDETSNFDALAAVEALTDTGFEGVVVPDHVPNVVGDTDWGHRGRAHAVAYLNGLTRCVRAGR